MSMTLYGIKNCDTVRKARKFLESQDMTYDFVDFKTADLDLELVIFWLSNYPDVINRRSKTYREIKADLLANEGDLEKIAELIRQYPTVIKRPLLVCNGTVLIGFDETKYSDVILS